MPRVESIPKSPLCLERGSQGMVRRVVAILGVSGGDLADLPREQVPDRVTSHNQIVTFGVRQANLSQKANREQVVNYIIPQQISAHTEQRI